MKQNLQPFELQALGDKSCVTLDSVSRIILQMELKLPELRFNSSERPQNKLLVDLLASAALIETEKPCQASIPVLAGCLQNIKPGIIQSIRPLQLIDWMMPGLIFCMQSGMSWSALSASS